MGYDFYYNTPYGYGNDVYYSAAGILGGIGAGLLSLLFLYVLVVYVFRSLGLYHLAKNRGIPHAWFAWIPVLCYYVLGKLDNDKVVLGEDIVLPHAEFFLPFLSLLSLAVMGEGGFFAVVLSVCSWVYLTSAYWRLFKIYRPKSRVSYTIWSAIVGAGFFVFAIRNDKPYDMLEPDKVYQKLYERKATINDHYEPIVTDLRNTEDQQLSDLRSQYGQDMTQEDLTKEQKQNITDQYHADRQAIKQDFNEQIARERSEQNFRNTRLDETVQEAAYPDQIKRPETLTNIDTSTSIYEKFPEENGMSVNSAKEISAPIEQLEIEGSTNPLGVDQLEITGSTNQLGVDQLEITGSTNQLGVDQLEITGPETTPVSQDAYVEELIEIVKNFQDEDE